ncbi:PucR family transcriptional regulator ligand-binding domain-containing protein [Nocardioides sp. NBC_00850]|uniref:PucR family transcriptional regulator n=1 Tax=Nocardioides sp. NBC_00850 TaxID=2976001 RepID=UPI00386DF756|nr:PucR family transcriptional regulator ligand-binding domain-containing protein [Nocardioides sp. NBC_00850]
MALVTVSRVLEMPVVRTAAPEVVAGRTGLDREVRWVHSAELAEIGALLRGGDLLLSTGIALPEDATELVAYADSLAHSDAAGLFIELGRRWFELPPALIERCDDLGLPLITLGHEVRFAAVAQVVGERIVDEQLADLREAQRVHDTFTELSISEAGPAEILQAAQRLCGAAVVLEDDQFRVLDYRPGPDDIDAFLRDWSTRSRRISLEGRSAWDPTNHWLVTRVGRRDRGWGRLIVQSDQRPSPGLVATAERAAAALAMHRLHDRQRDSVVRRTHHELLVALLNDPNDPDLVRRCELAGLPVHKRQFVAASVRAQPRPSDTAGITRVDEVVAAITHALSARQVPGLVGIIDQDVRVLLSLSRTADADLVADQLAATIVTKIPATITAARPVEDRSLIDHTLREAQQVMDALKPDQLAMTSTRAYRLEDAHLRGLLTLLAGDDRVALYADRELHALEAYDELHGTDLLAVVRALVNNPVSKSEAAASLHLSRPVFYDRLAKAARVIGADLDDPDIRVSLHVALLHRDLPA